MNGLTRYTNDNWWLQQDEHAEPFAHLFCLSTSLHFSPDIHLDPTVIKKENEKKKKINRNTQFIPKRKEDIRKKFVGLPDVLHLQSIDLIIFLQM